MTRVLGVVPARGGSKGIPRKNLVPVRGRPLLAYTLEVARASKRLTRTVLSTDDAETLEVGRSLGADAPFVRPADLATDTASSAAVVRHALEEVERQEGARYDAVCLLEPTCPLRTARDVDEAIARLLASDADAVAGVVRIEAPHPMKTYRIADGLVVPLFPDVWRHDLRRQDLPEAYAVNGAVYCVRRDAFLRTASLWGERAVPHVMPPERSVNIDAPLDVAMVERILEEREG